MNVLGISLVSLDFGHETTWAAVALSLICVGALCFVLSNRRKYVLHPAMPYDWTAGFHPVSRVAEDCKDASWDPFLDDGFSERRSGARRKGHSLSVVVSGNPDDPRPVPATILDRSTGGLCLLVDSPVEVGSILTVRLTDPNSPSIEVEVRNCKESGIECRLGCQFVRTPPSSVLILFG